MLEDKLAHLPKRKQRELAHIVRVLCERFDEATRNKGPRNRRGRIVKIILYGSHARGDWVEDHRGGYYSDYDILVVVNEERFTEVVDYWEVAEDQFMREHSLTGNLRSDVSLIVHSLGEMNDPLIGGRPFFTDIRRDGIMLYEAEKFGPLADPTPITPEDIQRQRQSYYDGWRMKKDNFFALAESSFHKGFFSDSAFLLHQVVERSYHAFMLVRTLYTPKLHNIVKLRGHAEAQDIRLADIWPRNTRFSRRAYERLRRAYIEGRYSLHYEITAEELTWLFERAAHLQTLVARLCEDILILPPEDKKPV